MNNKEAILDFCRDATYFMVRYDVTRDGDLGKILNKEELTSIDYDDLEVYRSIDFKNDDKLFVFNLLPEEDSLKVDNPVQLLINNLFEARTVELVYPDIFRWVYDGLSIKGYAIVPSGNPKQHSTITRYGGTEQFMKILRQHLTNIAKLRRGITPDNSFLNDTSPIEATELSVGSINKRTNMYSVDIKLSMSYEEILNASEKNIQIGGSFNKMKMKFWTKEINPDFIREAKRIKLNNTLKLVDDHFKYYPQPIKALMELPHKGNYNRYLLARFLLSIYSPQDAKFVYYSVLGDEELEHINNGNCKTQWNYIQNNMKRYGCPTNKELKKFIDKNTYKLSHPLEEIQKILGEKDNGDES